MFIDLALLFVFLAVLSKSSDIVVEHAEKLSDFYSISKLAIGFLLISILTSLPELSISVFASLVASSGIVLGNTFSSNIFNMFFIIGISAIIYNAIKIGKEETNEIATISIIMSVIIIYIILNSLFGPGLLGFAEGAFLLILFCVYAFFITKKKNIDGRKEVGKKSALPSFVFFVLAIAATLISAGLVVEYAIKVAGEFHLAEGFIAATLIAFGTSLPELSVILHATRRKLYSLTIGTCFGSSLTNMLLVLGSAIILRPINLISLNHAGIVNSFFMIPLLFNILASALFFYFAMRKKEISRTAGVLFVLIFLVYLAFISYLQL